MAVKKPLLPKKNQTSTEQRLVGVGWSADVSFVVRITQEKFTVYL